MVRVLFYVQHLLGIGHLRRTALISQALSAKGIKVIVAYGGMPGTGIDFGSQTEVIQLPPVRTLDTSFTCLVTMDGKPLDSTWKAHRRSILLSEFDRIAPDILLIEGYPFSRRRFHFELTPLLESAHRRNPRPLIACSVRDILVSQSKHHVSIADIIEQAFDLVLVHSDPKLVSLSATFSLTERISHKLYYTGYVTPQIRSHEDSWSEDGYQEIVISTGSGAVGFPLLMCALEASRESDRQWRALVGPNLLPAQIHTLMSSCHDNVVIEPNRPDFGSVLRRCAVSISQAGYNTMMDILVARCRAIVVPFVTSTETEQTVRARLFAERGIVTLIEEQDLSATLLKETVTRVLQESSPSFLDLAIDGAENTAERLLSPETLK